MPQRRRRHREKLKEITGELTGSERTASPTYVFEQGDPSYFRHYIGYSYYDPIGGDKAQYLQHTNLTVGKNYTLMSLWQIHYDCYRDRKPHA